MIKPVGSKILLKEYKMESSSGVILTSKSQPNNIREVVEVGPEVKSVKVGDKVISGEYSGNSFIDEGQYYVIVEEIDVMAVVKN